MSKEIEEELNEIDRNQKNHENVSLTHAQMIHHLKEKIEEFKKVYGDIKKELIQLDEEYGVKSLKKTTEKKDSAEEKKQEETPTEKPEGEKKEEVSKTVK